MFLPPQAPLRVGSREPPQTWFLAHFTGLNGRRRPQIDRGIHHMGEFLVFKRQISQNTNIRRGKYSEFAFQNTNLLFDIKANLGFCFNDFSKHKFDKTQISKHKFDLQNTNLTKHKFAFSRKVHIRVLKHKFVF